MRRVQIADFGMSQVVTGESSYVPVADTHGATPFYLFPLLVLLLWHDAWMKAVVPATSNQDGCLQHVEQPNRT